MITEVHVGMRQLKLLFLLLLFSVAAKAQQFTDSNLPIVIINTDLGQAIPDDPRILASMKIISHPDGSRNYVTDQDIPALLDYAGRINIEVRGSTSQDLPKKGYGLTTLQPDNVATNNVSLLGMPKENDWILNGLAFDPSLIRDYLSYNLARQIDDYAPRAVYCEVIINGEYAGLYLLEEKIKADSNRVNILKIAETDVATPDLTGGYITKSDKTTGGDPVAWQMSSYAGSTDFIHELPKPQDVTAQQQSYIHGQFSNLAVTAHIHNANIASGYPSLIDVPSFIDFMIMNELASNADGYQLSTFFHKDRSGKLRAGPIWDFNLTYGNDLFAYGFDRSKTDVWQFSNGDNEGAKFWTDLFNDPTFKCYFSKRWNALTAPGQPLKHNNLVSLIDNTVSYISEAVIRENEKWGTIPDHATEIENLKTFLYQRIIWMTDHLGPFSGCNTFTAPSLVITKINYNPSTSASFPVSNSQEFIEIKNTGNTTINLTGIYFRELGFTYRFPDNATIAAGQNLFLASNLATFQSKYGMTAFGQFTRNLSNSSQRLVLADAFGNVIDEVEYHDQSPWPDADGNGKYLQLVDTSLDNSLASSWTATEDTFLSTTAIPAAKHLAAYPNPVSQMLTIENGSQIRSIEIFDALGRLIFHSAERSKATLIDFSDYNKGLYLLKVSDVSGVATEKIIRQ